MLHVPDWVKPWPTTTTGARWSHVLVAWVWLAFGVYGVLELADVIPHNPVLKDKVANSIAVLFFVSVYANFGTHLGVARGAKAERAVETSGA